MSRDDYTGTATGPLVGVKVIDLTINVLGPLATQILGDMGADVVKVEPPGGDPMRRLGPGHETDMAAHFMALNRNKRSIELDLKQPPAMAALQAMITQADVLVLSMRSSAAERLGLDYPSLAASNPRLVYAAAAGYAQDGPDRDRPAYDDVIQGESGLAGMIGRANGEVRYAPMAIADKFCGTQLASAIGMALFARERSGQGQAVHLPMLETMTAFNIVDHFWEATFVGGEAPPKVGFSRMFSPNRRPYPTKDGHISLLAVTDAQWRRLLDAIDRAELADDSRFATLEGRTDNIDFVLGLLAERLLGNTTAYWRDALNAADIPNAPTASLEDIFASPYLHDTGFFQRLDHPAAGKTLQMRPPIDFGATPANVHRPQPTLGTDGADILREAGLDAAAIEAALKPA